MEHVEVRVPACWKDEVGPEEVIGGRRARESRRRHLPISYEKEGKRRMQEDEEEDEEEVITVTSKSSRKGKGKLLESERRHLPEPSYELENKRKKEEVIVTKPSSSQKGKKGGGRKDGVWEPPHWREQLANIRVMRKKRDAPVDTEGAAALAEKDCPPEVSSGPVWNE